MKNKNFKENSQRGFAPFIIVAIIAVLAIGGGAYVVTKNKQKAQVGDNLDTQANVNADINANTNANLGVNAKGSLRSLITVGKNVMCTFSSTAGGVSSSGVVYISASGSMRGAFTSETSAGTQTSSMIVKDGTTYVWSGTQGVKMKAQGSTATSAQTKSNVDLDSQIDYKCADWTVDESKFTLPASVNFLDIEAMMKGSALPSGVNWDGTIKGGTQ